MEKITSRVNPKIKEAASWLRKPGDFFLVEGFHNVEVALENGAVDTIFSLTEKDFGNVKAYLVTPEIIEKLSLTQSPEGIVALCKRKAQGEGINGNKALYLDNVQDPGNVGTILRTAVAFGFNDVILSKGCANPYNPKALLAGQGAIFTVNVVNGSPKSLQNLKEKGFKAIGTALRDSVPMETGSKAEGKIVIVLGNEGQGISEEVLSICDEKVRIDISGIESLNVAIAAGIAMHWYR